MNNEIKPCENNQCALHGNKGNKCLYWGDDADVKDCVCYSKTSPNMELVELLKKIDEHLWRVEHKTPHIEYIKLIKRDSGLLRQEINNVLASHLSSIRQTGGLIAMEDLHPSEQAACGNCSHYKCVCDDEEFWRKESERRREEDEEESSLKKEPPMENKDADNAIEQEDRG